MIQKNNQVKWTLITGACGGLGSAFTKSVLNDGSNVIITGTNAEKTQKFAENLKKEYQNLQILPFVMDLGNEKGISDLIESIKSNNLNVDRLINNAGLIVEGGFLELSEEKLLDAIRVNCLGTVALTRKILDNFDVKEILTVSSLGGFYPMPYMSIYASTKSLLEKLMVSLRQELKPRGVKVSVVCPGGIPTTPAMKDAIASQGFGGRITAKSPEFIANYSLKKLKKNKAVIIPGFANRFVRFISRFVSEKMLAKSVSKMWTKANKKRKIK